MVAHGDAEHQRNTEALSYGVTAGNDDRLDYCVIDGKTSSTTLAGF
jgi:hypothetical protein